jgi:hypothetical protein
VDSAALVVTIDVTAPVAPTITSFSPDSGTVGDGITNVNVLTLTGTAGANSTVTVYDGASLLEIAITDGSGIWSYTTAALSSSIHVFTATDTLSGTTGAACTALTVTVDTVAPAVTELLRNDAGSSTTDKITSSATLTGSGDANALVHFTVDGKVMAATATANASGAWTFTPTGLAVGSHTVVASETNVAGNTGSASLTFTLDTTAPVVTETLTKGKLTGFGDPNAVVHFTVDGKAIAATATATTSGAWSFTPSNLSSGSHTIVASETDVAGNTGSASLTVRVDNHHHIVAATAPTAMQGQNISVSSLSMPSNPSGHAIAQYGLADTGSEHFVFNDLNSFATAARLPEMTTLGYLQNHSNYNGNTPMMSDGMHTDSITLLSDYLASSLAAASDGHGGTIIAGATPIIAAPTAFMGQPMDWHFHL